MSNHPYNDPSSARERKRARFEPPAAPARRPSRNVFVIGGVASLLALAAVVYFWYGRGDAPDAPVPVAAAPGAATTPAGAAPAASRTPGGSPATPIAPDGDVFRIPAAGVTDRAAFFTTTAAGKTVPFFAVRDARGEPVVALDACSVCAHAKKGYQQQGDKMQCRNCGMVFPIKDLAKMGGKGGCHPVTLPARTEGDSVLVPRADVEAGVKYF